MLKDKFEIKLKLFDFTLSVCRVEQMLKPSYVRSHDTRVYVAGNDP